MFDRSIITRYVESALATPDGGRQNINNICMVYLLFKDSTMHIKRQQLKC